MMMATEAPIDDVVTGSFVVPAVATRDGELLARLCELPAGPWLAIVLDEIDVSALTAWDLPAYLAACQRMQSWCAAQLADAVARFAALPDVGAGVDKEVSMALREPVGAAQTRIWQAKRLRRLLPRVWRRMRDGDLPDAHVRKLVDATASVHDPQLMAELEDRVLAHVGGKTPAELARYAKDTLKRLDPTGESRRAKAARDEADVVLFPGQDGMGDVVVHAPVEDAVLVKRRRGCPLE